MLCFYGGVLGLMGYTLVLSEKREAAERIASALDDGGKPKHLSDRGVPYFEAVQNDRTIVIIPAMGHLYNVAAEKSGFYYPVFNVKWAPASSPNKSDRIRNWINVISKIAGEASEFVSGTDYDIEGEVIGYTILKYACGDKERQARRMIFSTLTAQELRKAFQNLSPSLDFKLAEAGEARHIVDFLWGINLSRALTLAAKNWSKRYATLSAGRVQAPTLKFLVDREKEIQSFVPLPYWEIHLKAKIGGKVYDLQYEQDRFDTEAEAKKIVADCSGQEGMVEDVEARTFRQNPPTPFDLGTLQSEAYTQFGYTPSRTLSIAERLYLDALISYPRTSSQKIPPQIDCREILSSLSRSREYTALASELLRKKDLKPNEGKKDDPAHPSIYPTGNIPERFVDATHRKLFDLVVKRFMAVFGPPALKEGIKVSIDVGGHRFYLYGRRILDEGWLKYYAPYGQTDEVILPALEKGQKITISDVAFEEKYTSPPPRYNPASLLKLMDDEHLGTKATRATIIDTLNERGYIRDERITVTELGFNVIETLEKYSPSIVSVAFTRALEEKMEQIENGNGGKDEVYQDAVSKLRDILEELKNVEQAIGEELSNALNRARLQDRTIGPCPKCKTGSLLILQSKKTGKRFVGCSNYSKGLCNAAFPLPQPPYTIKPLKYACKACHWPVIAVRSRGKRPWTLCLNPDCPTKKKKYRRR